VTGYPSGNYLPKKEVDRGHMAIYIARAIADPVGEAGVPTNWPEAPFPDVKPDDPNLTWCYKHIAYCAAEGVVTGYKDGSYHPERMVRRDQMALYVQRAFQLPMVTAGLN